MKRKLTATITAAALALGTTTVPAAAQTDEELLGRILAGAAILGITAKIIDDRKDREEAKAKAAAKKKKKKKPKVLYEDVSKRHYDRNGNLIIDGEISRLPHGTRKGARNARNTPIPRDCRVLVDTPAGDRVGYSSRCLDRNFDQARYLPPECEVLVRTSRGLRGVYGERCLARDGWKTVKR